MAAWSPGYALMSDNGTFPVCVAQLWPWHLAGVSKYNPLAARRSRRRSQVYALMSDTVAFPVFVAAVTMANNICHKYRTKIIHWQLVELELDLKDMLWCPMSRCRFVLPWKLWPLPIIHFTMQEYRNTIYFIGSSSSSSSNAMICFDVQDMHK